MDAPLSETVIQKLKTALGPCPFVLFPSEVIDEYGCCMALYLHVCLCCSQTRVFGNNGKSVCWFMGLNSLLSLGCFVCSKINYCLIVLLIYSFNGSFIWLIHSLIDCMLALSWGQYD